MTLQSRADKLGMRLRLAGALIFIGLLIEALTLTWNNPIAFVVFLGIGGLLIGAGILLYLLSLVSPAISNGH